MRLARTQTKFLEDDGSSEEEALDNFNLAPLSTRRDIAMLGVLHRAAAGKGPPHVREHFKVTGQRQLEDPRSRFKHPLFKRSALGLVAVYNALPMEIKQTRDVKSFQSLAQAFVKRRLF